MATPIKSKGQGKVTEPVFSEVKTKVIKKMKKKNLGAKFHATNQE